MLYKHIEIENSLQIYASHFLLTRWKKSSQLLWAEQNKYVLDSVFSIVTNILF